MRVVSVLLLFLLAALVPFAATTSKKKTAPAKKSASTKPAAKSTAKKSTAKKSTSSKTKTASRSSRSRRKSAVTWRNRQLRPTQERYQAIQRALASKGYFQGEVNGVWDQASVEALRTFQRDQNLEASGTIDSLSLIALGLGPNYETASKLPPSQTAQP